MVGDLADRFVAIENANALLVTANQTLADEIDALKNAPYLGPELDFFMTNTNGVNPLRGFLFGVNDDSHSDSICVEGNKVFVLQAQISTDAKDPADGLDPEGKLRFQLLKEGVGVVARSVHEKAAFH